MFFLPIPPFPPLFRGFWPPWGSAQFLGVIGPIFIGGRGLELSKTSQNRLINGQFQPRKLSATIPDGPPAKGLHHRPPGRLTTKSVWGTLTGSMCQSYTPLIPMGAFQAVAEQVCRVLPSVPKINLAIWWQTRSVATWRVLGRPALPLIGECSQGLVVYWVLDSQGCLIISLHTVMASMQSY